MSWLPVIVSFGGELLDFGLKALEFRRAAKAGEEMAMKIALDDLKNEGERLIRKKARGG